MRRFLSILVVSHLLFFERLNGGDRHAAEFGTWRVVVFSFFMITMATVSPVIIYTLSLFISLKDVSSLLLATLHMVVAGVSSILLTLPLWKNYGDFIAEANQGIGKGSRSCLLFFPFALILNLASTLLIMVVFLD